MEQTTINQQSNTPIVLPSYVEKRSIYNMQPAEQINPEIAQLPTAHKKKVYLDNGQEIKGYEAVEVVDKSGHKEIVDIPKESYTIVQHARGFEPIREGLVQAGIHDFKFILTSTMRRAQLQIYTSNAGYDGVSLGFSVENSFDGSKALSYGFKISEQKTVIEMVGYRQVCSNGMKVRVPLENAEFVREETRAKILNLFEEHCRILHTPTAEARIPSMQYVAEAIALMQEPLELYIRKAQKWTIDNEDILKRLIKAHVGKRFQAKVMERYTQESRDLWGLYNALTYVASHDPQLKPSARDSLIDKASMMLEKELTISL
jgi:hypothetical protein